MEKFYVAGMQIIELVLAAAAVVALIMWVFSIGPDLSWFHVLFLAAFTFGADRVRAAVTTAATRGLKK